MATKSSLSSSINTQITSIITQAKHRLSMALVVDEIFQTTTTQNLISGSNVFWHNLNYKKQGNIVHIDGFIINKYSVAKSGVVIITIPNSELYAKTGQDTIVFGFTDATGTPVQLSFATSSIYLLGNLAPNQRIYINAHYQTND